MQARDPYKQLTCQDARIEVLVTATTFRFCGAPSGSARKTGKAHLLLNKIMIFLLSFFYGERGGYYQYSVFLWHHKGLRLQFTLLQMDLTQ